jgi:hypothetical protein
MEIPTTTELPIFEPNQVLTSTNLNRLRTYLDQQNRLTRIRLTGTGIFCGLRIRWVQGANGYVEIKAGYGITTEGYLLGINSAQLLLKRVKPWKDPTDPDYRFGNGLPDDARETDPVKFTAPKATDPVRTNVWELFEKGTEGQPLNDVIQPETAGNWAVVIFYEINDEDLRSCSTSNCDNKGKLRKATQRYLLVNKAELLANDFGADDDFPAVPIALPLLNTRRLPAAVLQEASSRNELYTGYQNLIIAPQKQLLRTSIQNAFQRFSGVLGLDINALNTALNALDAIEAGVAYKQQAADVLSHITMAYNDFAIAAGAFSSGCGYLPGNYPRHLTLGLLTLPAGGSDSYRHNFVSVRGAESAVTARNARTLFNRMLRLITDFKKLPLAKSVEEIRITPGGWAPQKLELRAIPYYYNPAENNNRIAKLWYPARSGLGLWSDHLSYYSSHNPAAAGTSWYDSAIHWSMQQNPFLRIEGFTGLSYKQVKLKLEQLKVQHNLSFNVISLKLNTRFPNPETDKLCGFEDLQEDYLLERQRLLGFLDQVIGYMQLFIKEAGILVGDPQGFNAFIGELALREANLAKLLPVCIHDFKYVAFRNQYRIYVDEIIDFIFSIDSIEDVINLPDRNKEWSDVQKSAAKNMISNIIGKLTYLAFDNLFFQRFYKIYYRYKLRELRRSKFFTFSGFAAARPGLEHLSGTMQGGTFVLVYESDKADGVPPPDDDPDIDPYSDPYPGLGIQHI